MLGTGAPQGLALEHEHSRSPGRSSRLRWSIEDMESHNPVSLDFLFDPSSEERGAAPTQLDEPTLLDSRALSLS